MTAHTFLALPILLLAACSSSETGCETSWYLGDASNLDCPDAADTASDAGSQDSGTFEQSVLIQEWFGNCSGGECRWEVAADGQIGTVELELIETGDPSFDCSQATDGQLVCGVWTEYHTRFALTDEMNAYGGETKSITLALADDYREQVNNQSTLFSNELMRSTLTYMFIIVSPDGQTGDCIVDGHDPSYYASVCANLF